MKEFKDYSLPQLYGSTGQGPQNPAEINWRSVAIYAGISIASAVVMAVIINQSSKSLTNQWQIHSSKLHEQHIAAMEQHLAEMRKLIERIHPVEANKAPQEEKETNISEKT